MNLVEKIAKKMNWLELPYEDRVIAGYEGLEIAKKKFDPNKNVKFETYAYNYIKGKIIDETRKYNKLIKLPQKIQSKIWKINRIQRTLKQENGYEPSLEEIGEKTKMSTKEIKKMLSINEQTKTVPLNNKIAVEEKPINDFRKLALKALEHLTPNEQISVANYFGFELPENNKTLSRKPPREKIKKIIEKLQKNASFFTFLQKNVQK